MKLWVDDYRDAPDDTWHEVRNVTEAIRVLYAKGSEITEVSLDHDIEHSTETFMPVAMYLALMRNDLHTIHMIWKLDRWVPKITIHSINPVGAKAMQDMFKEYSLDVPYQPYKLAEFNEKYGIE